MSFKGWLISIINNEGYDLILVFAPSPETLGDLSLEYFGC
ncbi:hypothetical protein PAECIP111890_01814 [Paenibacillus sp. JJ-223]|nr:hypothetical protein PAECIP111890_01814 [Paenibacillus sp. JJ-223]